MDLIFMMQGTTAYGDFGAGLAALDFNGDGFDDLAVLQRGWAPDSLITNPPTVMYGRILIYYGGPNFDSVPDFIIEGTYSWQFCPSQYSCYLVNLGDVNGDGYDDLSARGYTNYSDILADSHKPYVAAYFGGQNPSTQPGYYKSFPSPHSGGYAEIDPLGDINNDGFDDFSYTYHANSSYNELSRTDFILGDSMTEVVWRQYNGNDGGIISMHPSGDVNNDGFDDYTATYTSILGPGNYTYSNTLYYGSSFVQPADSLVLYSGQNINVYRTNYLGDLNGDGKDDFCGRIYYPNAYIWYGNENLTSQFNLILNPAWSGNNSDGRGLIYGDLNNDGYDDVIGSMPISHGENGGFRIWLGGASMNGTSDLEIAGTHSGMLLGTGMAAGDFNGDGLCDIAASAPHSSTFDSTPGRVYVYAGNAQLADTTVDIQDNTIIKTQDNWSFKVVPNPMYGKQNWKLKLTGKGFDRYRDMTVIIYNLKGQRVKAIHISSSQLKTGEISLSNLNLPAGVYEISLYDKGNLLKTRKATIK